MALNFKHVHVAVVKIETERLEWLREHLAEHHETELDAIRDITGEEDEGIEFYAEEVHKLDTVRKLADELAIVGLYRTVELHADRMIDRRFGVGTAQREQLFRWQRLQRFVQRNCGFASMALPDAPAVNELRLLNNCVKHGRIVSRQLAAYPGWATDEDLPALGSAFERLRPGVSAFMTALADRVLGP